MTAAKDSTESRLELPLPKGKIETVIGTIKGQLAAAGAAPDLPNQPKIQDAIKATQDDVDAVEKTLGKISTMRTALTALLGTRRKQVFALRINHESLQNAINLAGQGDKDYLKTYGGSIMSRSTLETTDEVPVNPSFKATKISGQALAKCKADPRAYAYAFQFGTEQNNPDGWPKPEIESGSAYLKTGLPPGQKMYCRIAIYRRGQGLGKWSPVMDVVVP